VAIDGASVLWSWLAMRLTIRIPILAVDRLEDDLPPATVIPEMDHFGSGARGPDGDQPTGADRKGAMPTTGEFKGFPPIDPWKGASPNENTPPSAAANQ
jgi:hypothetical protein